jgi:flagellar biosynthesis GTPase FlhF
MGKPISYLTRGQRIPEDLEPATRDVILDMVLKATPAGSSRFGVAAA